MKSKTYVLIAVYPSTRTNLRHIAANADEQLCRVVERLAQQELAKTAQEQHPTPEQFPVDNRHE